MRLCRCGQGRRDRAHHNVSTYGDGRQDLRCRLGRCHRLRSIRDRPAARMLPASHLAVACHLLAARHLRSCHLRIWQARECGYRQPNGEQTQHHHRTASRHDSMLTSACLSLQVLISPAASRFFRVQPGRHDVQKSTTYRGRGKTTECRWYPWKRGALAPRKARRINSRFQRLCENYR